MRIWGILFCALTAGVLSALAVLTGATPIAAFVVVFLLAAVFFYAIWPAGHKKTEVPESFVADQSKPTREEISALFGQSLIEKLPTPLLVVSQKGLLTYANTAALESLPRLKTGQHIAHVIRAPAFMEAIAATMADGQDRSFQFTSYFPQEQFYDARVSLFTFDGGAGSEPKAIIQIEDRTRAHRAEQLRSDFIANASHELRTPLASIIGYIETLQNHARDDAGAREQFLSVMSREAGRMQRLVDELMSLSRIEMNEHIRPEETVSLNRIALECAAALQPLASQEGAALKADLEPDGGDVCGDRDQLAQVISNLIDNAIKYGGPSCEVRVYAAAPDKAHPNRVGICVEDTGPGIARDNLHRLTERFYRVNVGQSRNKGGTGLGLAIVKHILNRHKGRMEVTSEPGKGSKFTIRLPRAAAAGPEAAEQENEPENPGGKQLWA